MATNPLPSGFFSRHDIQEYRWLVGHLHEGDTLVELGVWLGRSLCSVAHLVREKHLNVVAVDTFTKSSERFKQVITRPQMDVFLENMARFGVTPRCIQSQSHLAAPMVASAGLVFIDAAHDYESVVRDIKAWKGKARILAGHDYNMPKFGVKRAVDELFPDARVRGNIWSVRP